MADCQFCAIIAGNTPAIVVREWRETIAIVPLNPVIEGHTLVISKAHVEDFTEAAHVTATTMHRAAEHAGGLPGAMNLITSRGADATQTVFHLHVHLVPRRPGDGLALPWTGQEVSRD